MSSHQSIPLGSHQPGNSPVHRLGAGPKLAALFAVSLVVVLVRSPVLAVALVCAAFALAAVARLRLRPLLRQLRFVLLLTAMVVAYRAWQAGWDRAVETGGDLLGLVLLSTVVTATTPVDDILDVVVRCVEPFRRFGAHPERVALAFSLTLSAIPTTFEIAAQTRDAAAARGLERSPRARFVPLVIRVVARARATGEALDARGVGD